MWYNVILFIAELDSRDNTVRICITPTRFQDRNPTGDARFGRTDGHVISLLLNGFTKSTKVNDFGPELNTTKQLQDLEPYVAR